MKNTVKITPKGAVQLANGEAAERGTAAFVQNLRERDDALACVGNCAVIGSLRNGERVVLADNCGEAVRLLTFLPNEPTNSSGTASENTASDDTIAEGHSAEYSATDGAIFWHSVVAGGDVTVVGVKLCDVAGYVTSARSCGNFAVIATTAETVVLQRLADGYKRLDTSEIQPLILLTDTEHSAVSHQLSEYTFNSPYTSWTALSAVDRSAISKMVNSALQAMCSSAAFDGRYCGCLAARIGVRLYDDSYLWMSAPQTVGADLISSASAWTRVNLTADGSGITQTRQATLSIDTFRLGVTVVEAFGEAWDGIIKAVDLLVAPQPKLFDTSTDVQTRCATTSSGTREQYLLIAPATRSHASIADALVNAPRWQVVSSTSNFAALRQGKWIAGNSAESLTQTMPPFITYSLQSASAIGNTVSASQCADAVALSGSKMVCQSLCSNIARTVGAGLTVHRGMPWNIAEYFAPPLSNAACVAAIEVTLSSAQGNSKISTWENLPFTPSAIAPIVTFPDPRATHIRIWLQGSGEVMQWQADMMPDASSRQATAVSANLENHPLNITGDQLITLPQQCVISESLAGWIAMSGKGNPLVWQLSRPLAGTAIKAIASATSPAYHSGLGRYPLFIFATDGIYALPLLSSGTYGEVRMLSRHTIATGSQPCETSRGIFFTNTHGDVMSIGNGIIKRHLQSMGAVQMAWNEAENELWLMKSDGSITVMMPGGRTYCRTITTSWLYSAANAAFAAESNTLLDITRETAHSAVTVQWLSQPIMLSPTLNAKPRGVVWNIFSDECALQLQINGERGMSCHGFALSRLSISGIVGSPICHRIVAPRLRSIRLGISGQLKANEIILPIYLQ
ncbi:MAG: hypothetical protein ACI30V_09585 [Muribaculaceae bacterium]